MGAVWRWPRTVGRTIRPIQYQAIALHQHRYPDGGLVHPRDHLCRRGSKGALPNARSRRGSARRLGAIVVSLREAKSCHRSSPVPSTRASGSALGRHRHGSAQGGGLLLLSGVPRARHRPDSRHQQERLGELQPGRTALIETAAASEYATSLAEFNTNNALWLRKLRDEGAVKILKFDDSVLRAFLKYQQGRRGRGWSR